MSRRVSFAGRAALAVALMIGFYVLAVGIVAVLLFIPYAEIAYFHRLNMKITLACLAGAGVILVSIVPRPDRFEPPGPPLAPEQNPRLFHELEDVARATSQPMPTEVYLVNDVNAFVTERGGWMGFGSRRVMGLGLPLMQVLTVPEFRGVVAHEFGHYDGGDTRLGPWIYKTRGALGRTLEGLGSSMLQKPFAAYAQMFLRITHGISRAQEYAADALAAGIVGACSMMSGLRTIHRVAALYPAYWDTEAAPVLGAGFRAPLAEGFQRFLAEPRIARTVSQIEDEAMKPGAGDPFDTHPPLPQRLAALEELPPGPQLLDAPRAVTLLGDVDQVERSLLAVMAGEKAESLPRVGWDETGLRVFLPDWQKLAADHAGVLAGITPGGLPDVTGDLTAFARPIVLHAFEKLPQKQWVGFADHVVGAATSVVLHHRGYRLECLPGAPVVFRDEGGAIEPFRVLQRLADGSLLPADWRAQCESFGIGEIDLGSAAG